jgi:hypothetical protein
MNRQTAAALTANNQLLPGELAFGFGNTLPALDGNSSSVQILADFDASGTVISAQLVIIYPIDPDNIKSSTSPNEPPVAGGYQVNFNEVGFPGNKELFDTQLISDLFVSFTNSGPYLNVKLPLTDAIKRDFGS